MGRLAKLNDNLRGAAGHCLAASQIERHALPPPVVDPELHGSECGVVTAGAHAFRFSVAAILAAQSVPVDIVAFHGPNRLQDFYLFVANGVSREVDGGFHRHQA